MFFQKIKKALVFGVLCAISIASDAQTTLVAVASNFTKPMTEIAAEFEKATGHTAQLSFGASGKFVAQIENDAPFDVFLAADEKNPLALVKAGLGVEDNRFVYAVGKLVLWSATPNYVDEQGDILLHGQFTHLALADPKLAPYGAGAIEILQSKGLLEKYTPLLVQGENISQAYQFISTGNAELGFIALSQVFENEKITSGSAWIVPQHLYKPINQSAILLKKGTENTAAIALLNFLKSPPALAIIQKYGYGLAK